MTNHRNCCCCGLLNTCDEGSKLEITITNNVLCLSCLQSFDGVYLLDFVSYVGSTCTFRGTFSHSGNCFGIQVNSVILTSTVSTGTVPPQCNGVGIGHDTTGFNLELDPQHFPVTIPTTVPVPLCEIGSTVGSVCGFHPGHGDYIFNLSYDWRASYIPAPPP